MFPRCPASVSYVQNVVKLIPESEMAAVSGGVIPSAVIHRSEGHGGVPGFFRKRPGLPNETRTLCQV